MNQTEILKALKEDLDKISDPVEKYTAMSIIVLGKSIAMLTVNNNWDMLNDLENTIGSLFVEANMVREQQQNQAVNWIRKRDSMMSTIKQRVIEAINDPCSFVDGDDVSDCIMLAFNEDEKASICQDGLCVMTDGKFILTQAGAELLEQHKLQ
jgi:hypothetical protein